MKKTFWIDMDGVLVQYDYSIYTPDEDGVMPFMFPHTHCFLRQKPDENMVRAFNLLYEISKRTGVFDVHVLTSIPQSLIQGEHTMDKFEWCKTYLGTKDFPFDERDFYCTSVKKHNAVAESLWELTESDILVDDYKPNLYNWQDKGGRAIKCLNGINSYGKDFLNISTLWHPNRIAGVLLGMAHCNIFNGQISQSAGINY
ncbi:MAG: hypothetical protein K5773_01630 [Pseudobutyrivibrio sp.]|nr:hypothetical protein [Pseudobutyrivibrio sp.]